MLTAAYNHSGPAAVRYPRGTGPGVTIPAHLEPIAIGQAETRFFFSSRRRHTICGRDWSSDVCSSDLAWETPFEVPPFEEIKIEHYKPAFSQAIEEHKKEIDAIAGNSESATFDNTIVALENAGQLLSRVSTVFFNLRSSHTNDDMQLLAQEMRSEERRVGKECRSRWSPE